MLMMYYCTLPLTLLKLLYFTGRSEYFQINGPKHGKWHSTQVNVNFLEKQKAKPNLNAVLYSK